MEIRNHATNMQMHERLKQALAAVRKHRAFNVEEFVEAKCKLLNSYYRQAGLKSAVVAVSGGIDSAVVLGLIEMASRFEDSPIEHIISVTMPDNANIGVTGQSEAARLAHLVCHTFGTFPYEIEIAGISEAIYTAVEQAVAAPSLEKLQWCRGQVTSYARTPTYYYITSVLAAQGRPGLVIGTTNLSEGGYLGYFGKASDGMVDVQLISDIYKSEVYEVGRFLGVPEEVLGRAPTGDMFDSTTDEVVFGAPYDFVELFQEHRRGSDSVRYDVQINLGRGDINDATQQWDEYAANLERMHAYNAHKYLGRSPAVHLDIMPCGVTGGWDNPAWRPQ